MKRLIVHMIGNAHLDPVWLWRQPAGIDEAIGTCRTACDLLDEYQQLYVTRGEAWVHRTIQRIDPALFERIRRHVASGRWQIVNGWWIQPDCNLPTAVSFRMHGRMGAKYFRENLGAKVTVGYNVDSFGHNAMMPTFLREAGMDCYCFMRPGAHEKELPANLFTWRSPAGDAVTAFRISGAYTSWDVAGMVKVLDKAIADSNRDVGHTMSFYGVGDHGGGPTRQEVEWILANRAYREDVEIRLSHPRAFFDAAAESGVTLPVVTGELQYHAIGCYSVQHGLKQAMRRSENLATQAGRVVEAWPAEAGGDAAARLEEAWDKILFNQFHDILAGSSIETACDDARAQLGFARTIAEEIIVTATRRRNVSVPLGQGRRLTLANLSDRRYSGYVEFEPWTGWRTEEGVTLIDKDGVVVPSQRILQEAATGGILRLLMRVDLRPMERRSVEMRPGGGEQAAGDGQDAARESGVDLALAGDGIAQVNLAGSPDGFLSGDGIRVVAFRDTSDTWSHGIARFDGGAAGEFKGLGEWTPTDGGPLSLTMIKRFAFGESSLVWRVIRRAGEPIVRMRLKIHWKGSFRVLKLLIPTIFAGGRRIDGCPGGWIAGQTPSPAATGLCGGCSVRKSGDRHYRGQQGARGGHLSPEPVPVFPRPAGGADDFASDPGGIARPFDGREYPFHDYLVLSGGSREAGGAALAVVTADAYGVDVSQDGLIRITLLRSPAYAHHDPMKLPSPNYFPITDQGIHEYEIALMPAHGLSMEAILDEASRQTRPVWIAEG